MLTLFAGRLVQLQGMESGTYQQLAATSGTRPPTARAARQITGANGQVLAMTVATYPVYADPPQMPVASSRTSPPSSRTFSA